MKFLILITGSIVIPMIVFAISFGFGKNFESFRQLKTLHAPLEKWRVVLRTGNEPLDRDNIERNLESIPGIVSIQVFDEMEQLIYSRESEGLDLDDYGRTIQESMPVSFLSGETGTAVFVYPWFRKGENLFYIPLTGLVFIAIMAIIIGQSINHSISALEKATRRIAEGDLDFELPQKGSDKLAALTGSFDSMRKHLKEEYARRARFIMGISHDLKTPLSSISGYIDAIRDGYADTPEKLEKYTSIIESKTKILESRISILIDFIRKETSEWKLSLQPVELNTFLNEFAGLFEAEASVRNYRFEHKINIRDRVSVPMDQDMVIRAFENLTHNALQYSPDNSTIIFSAKQANGEISISFLNEGPGISAEDLPHIFDPFARGARDRKGGGFGLGLATVESVITSHGWNVSVESEPDKQTVFTITIPLVEKHGNKEIKDEKK